MHWFPEKKLSYLPSSVHKYFQDEAQFLFRDLEANRLIVVLIPAPDLQHSGHRIRVATSYNPEWYSDIYWNRPRIYRYLSLSSLARIAEGRDGSFSPRNWKYHLDTKYRQLIFERLTKGHKHRAYTFPPSNIVREFFDLAPVEESMESLEKMCADVPYDQDCLDEDIPF